MNDEEVLEYSEVHHELAYRKLQGETLSPDEDLVLAALTQFLKRELKRPSNLSKEEKTLFDKMRLRYDLKETK